MAKKKDNNWLIVGLGLMAVALIGKLIFMTSHDYSVVYFQGNQIPGYEARPESVDIFPASYIISKNLFGLGDIVGWIFWFGILAACWYVNENRHQGNINAKDAGGRGFNTGKGIAIVAVPVVLCFVFFFAKGSAKLDHNKWQGSFADFKTTFQISDKVAEKVKAEGGSGTLYIKDENGLMKKYFTGK